MNKRCSAILNTREVVVSCFSAAERKKVTGERRKVKGKRNPWDYKVVSAPPQVSTVPHVDPEHVFFFSGGNGLVYFNSRNIGHCWNVYVFSMMLIGVNGFPGFPGCALSLNIVIVRMLNVHVCVWYLVKSYSIISFHSTMNVCGHTSSNSSSAAFCRSL